MKRERVHGIIKHGLALAGGILAVTIVILWAWNELVAGLFSGPEIHFKQANALVVSALVVRSLFCGGVRRHAPVQ